MAFQRMKLPVGAAGHHGRDRRIAQKLQIPAKPVEIQREIGMKRGDWKDQNAVHGCAQVEHGYQGGAPEVRCQLAPICSIRVRWPAVLAGTGLPQAASSQCHNTRDVKCPQCPGRYSRTAVGSGSTIEQTGLNKRGGRNNRRVQSRSCWFAVSSPPAIFRRRLRFVLPMRKSTIKKPSGTAISSNGLPRCWNCSARERLNPITREF